MQSLLLLARPDALPGADGAGRELHRLLRAGRVRLAAWSPAGASGGAWEPLGDEDAVDPALVVMFLPGASDGAERERLLRAARTTWPGVAYRLVEVVDDGLDAATCLKVLAARPALYRLLPDDLLLPFKQENDYLRDREWNALLRAVVRVTDRRFAILGVPAVLPAEGVRGTYFSWVDGVEAAEQFFPLADQAAELTALDPVTFEMRGEGPGWRSASRYRTRWLGERTAT